MSQRDDYAGGARARYVLMGAALFLTLFGLVMIYSASSIQASVKLGSDISIVIRQVGATLMGVVVAFLLARFDYRFIKDRAWTVWTVTLASLLVVLILGVASHGAQRWIPLGLFNLQPSEFAKITAVLLVCALAVDWQRGRMPDKSFWFAVLAAVAIPSAFIIAQPDMGTTATLVAACAMVLILAGVEWKYILGTFVGLVSLGVLFIGTSSYRMERVTAFMNPWADAQDKGYQSVQALLAFGTGGIDGVGLGLSRQKFFYLPEAHNDFILAIIGEEAGLLGSLAVVAAFVVLTWAGFKIASGSKDPYGRLVAGGITGMLAFQAIINMAAVTGLMPVTGKPLPFVSFGGTSVLATLTCVGILLSVSEYGARSPRAVKVRKRNEGARRESSAERGRDRGTHLSRVDGGRASRRRA